MRIVKVFEKTAVNIERVNCECVQVRGFLRSTPYTCVGLYTCRPTLHSLMVRCRLIVLKVSHPTPLRRMRLRAIFAETDALRYS